MTPRPVSRRSLLGGLLAGLLGCVGASRAQTPEQAPGSALPLAPASADTSSSEQTLTWSASSLPAGLSSNDSTGLITGTFVWQFSNLDSGPSAPPA